MESQFDFNDNSVYITAEEMKKDSFIWSTDPYDYFNDDSRMLQDSVIGCANLSRTELKGEECFYPYSSYIHPDYRGLGLGSQLYKLIISSIRFMSDKMNIRPMLCQHSAYEPYYGATSTEAERVYSSLERSGSIERYSMYRLGRSYICDESCVNAQFSLEHTKIINNTLNLVYSVT